MTARSSVSDEGPFERTGETPARNPVAGIDFERRGTVRLAMVSVAGYAVVARVFNLDVNIGQRRADDWA
ncbi:MAG TPA: hypothetical protein VIJ11_05560 [Galbitalea sp.]